MQKSKKSVFFFVDQNKKSEAKTKQQQQKKRKRKKKQEAVTEFWARKEQVFELSSASSQLQLSLCWGDYVRIYTHIYWQLVSISLPLSGTLSLSHVFSCAWLSVCCIVKFQPAGSKMLLPQAAALFILYFLQRNLKRVLRDGEKLQGIVACISSCIFR